MFSALLTNQNPVENYEHAVCLYLCLWKEKDKQWKSHVAELAVQRKAIHAKLDRLREFRVRFDWTHMPIHQHTHVETLLMFPGTEVRLKRSKTECNQMSNVSSAKYANQYHTCLTCSNGQVQITSTDTKESSWNFHNIQYYSNSKFLKETQLQDIY